MLVKAVALTGRAQSTDGGWIYRPDTGGDEGSVTITQVQALRAAAMRASPFPRKSSTACHEIPGGFAEHRRRDSVRAPAAGALPASQSPPRRFCAGTTPASMTTPGRRRRLPIAGRISRPGILSGGHDYYAHLYWSQALVYFIHSLLGDYYAQPPRLHAFAAATGRTLDRRQRRRRVRHVVRPDYPSTAFPATPIMQR